MPTSKICQNQLRREQPKREVTKQRWQSNRSDKISPRGVIPRCEERNAQGSAVAQRILLPRNRKDKRCPKDEREHPLSPPALIEPSVAQLSSDKTACKDANNQNTEAKQRKDEGDGMHVWLTLN
jgi:hypothetical protein